MLEMQVSEFHTLTSQKALGAALVPTAGRPPGLLLLQHVGEALLPMRLLSYSSRATGRTSLVPSGLSGWRPSPSATGSATLQVGEAWDYPFHAAAAGSPRLTGSFWSMSS